MLMYNPLSMLLISFILVWGVLLYFYYVFGFKTQNLVQKLRSQGIQGPPQAFMYGNLKQIKKTKRPPPLNYAMLNPENVRKEILLRDYAGDLFPFNEWSRKYGRTYLFALGTTEFLFVSDPKFVKEINSYTSLGMGKPDFLQTDRKALLGKGVISSSGLVWSHGRKTVAPLLYADKVKEKFDVIMKAGRELVNSWEKITDANGGAADVNIDQHILRFSSYNISNMVFGDDCEKAMGMFWKFLDLVKAMSKLPVVNVFPFSRYLPHEKNKAVWKIDSEICSTITGMAKKQDPSSTLGGMIEAILEGSKTSPLKASDFIVDNIKSICVPASQVVALAGMWGIMLLASHPKWQTLAREEILSFSKDGFLDYNMLSQMKVLKMIILETLRLYSGVMFVLRQAMEDMKLGNLDIPKGLNLWLWLPALHRDPEVWGHDADKFNPGRFANGVSGACSIPHAFLPFGVGSRVCPGQAVAMVELKVLFAMILSKFSFTLSPSYRHAPTFGLLLEPEFGVDIRIQKL